MRNFRTGLAALREDNFWGKTTYMEPSPGRDSGYIVDMKEGEKEIIFPKNKIFVASGYAAVWAVENSREALFDAMQKKETYATQKDTERAKIAKIFHVSPPE